ncbi:MAG: NUDIX hydrolase [Planctomycetota bacterium]|jgi:ADP-ribose/FAD diphosphatase|nr:NUDIX hydrolase [Planctomycetota bacterium]
MVNESWTQAERTPFSMRFCPKCGGRVESVVPSGDDRVRAVCSSCGEVHYKNPTMVVGCLVEAADGILLCRRSIEPGYGLWTLPAGFQELNEGLIEGACRETREEACADVEVTAPHAFIDIPHVGQGYAIFRASLCGSERPQPGDETLETAFVQPGDLPWKDIAFPAVSFALRFFVDDLKDSKRRVHHATLRLRAMGKRFDVDSYDVVGHQSFPLGEGC